MGVQQSRSDSQPPSSTKSKFRQSLIPDKLRAAASSASLSKRKQRDSAQPASKSATPTSNNTADDHGDKPATDAQDASKGADNTQNDEANAENLKPRSGTSNGMVATVPCAYRTGRTLGSGTYAIVKEAVHIETGKKYACKVINKKLMEGREHMVRNEISVLKRVSSGYRNIVTLHDYFETAHNLYLCFDLCDGGELFDRICAKGNYYEADAAELVRTIFRAVNYIHSCGIVHRDLKPENLLFRTPAEDADIMIADFGLSRVMDEDKHHKLTEICGTPGYMAPEIFKKTGHGKPVDVWAMGVVTYFLLAGYTPFDRDTQQQEMQAICAGDYKFEPEEYWANVTETAKDFVRQCLTLDPAKRPTAADLLEHKWLVERHFVAEADGAPADLLPHVKKAFNARKLWRKATTGIKAMNRMTALAAAHGIQSEVTNMKKDLEEMKQESDRENVTEVIFTHTETGKSIDDKSKSTDEIRAKLANTDLGGDGKQKEASTEPVKDAPKSS